MNPCYDSASVQSAAEHATGCWIGLRSIVSGEDGKACETSLAVN